MKTFNYKQTLTIAAATIVGCLCGAFIDAHLFQIDPALCCVSEGLILGSVQALIFKGVI